MSCHQLEPLLSAFADGELSPDQVLEVEQHLADCGDCTEKVRFELSLKHTLQRIVHTSPYPEAALRRRVNAALATERADENQRSWVSRTVHWPHWRGVAAFAAAAAVTLIWTNRQAEIPSTSSMTTAGIAGASSASQNVEQLIDDLVSEHATFGNAPTVIEPQAVRAFESEVGVPVRIPQLRQLSAHWVGGKLVNPGGQRMAAFEYKVSGHRVTVYVFDPQRAPIHARLKAQVIHNKPVFLGTRRGYSIAAIERRGVGYAVATDLGNNESAEIILNSVLH